MRMKYFISVLACVLMITASSTQDTISSINKAISSGNAQQISPYLNSMVEMNILGNEGYVSKVQIENILSAFFKEHPPINFSVKQGGSVSENTKFSIGIYTSNKKETYRIYYVVKKNENEIEKINKLIIEEKK